ncbi:hypothetical protein [Bifidobacterium callimiconis]|nr:hypothetical protein [Bifidobacterium callimiconis]MBT1177688.1 hypothetical protein [Bifidobacterium callimiconis]
MAKSQGIPMGKIGLFALFIAGFWLVAVAWRTSIDPATGMEFAAGMSTLPFAGGIFHVLNSFMHVDTSLFSISSGPFFLIAIIILIVQGALQAPLMLLLNGLFGPFLFSPYQRGGYSVVADPNIMRAKDKLLNKAGKLLGSLIATICVALFAAWLVNYALDWVNQHNILVRILIYVVAVAIAGLLVVAPFLISGVGHDFLVGVLGNLAQSVVYAFITNVCIIAVVMSTTAGPSIGQIGITLLVFLAWMIIYTDTDGYFIHSRGRR